MGDGAMIIDCHCHAGKGDGLTGPWDTAAPLDRYEGWAREAGILRTVLFSAFHSNYAAANEEVARIVNRNPDRYFGFAFVHADRDRGRIGSLVETAIGDYGFVGIKVHRFDARLSREICDVAKAYHVPVLYDPVGEVSIVELVAVEYPEVNFIIPHMGSFSDDWRAQHTVIDYLERHPNVFIDTSGVRRFELLEQAVERAGAEKVLFGSDGPWLHPGVELAKVKALKLPAADERLVLSGNFLRLIGQRRLVAAPKVSTRQAELSGEYRDPWLVR
jgi:uncharacterized protein